MKHFLVLAVFQEAVSIRYFALCENRSVPLQIRLSFISSAYGISCQRAVWIASVDVCDKATRSFCTNSATWRDVSSFFPQSAPGMYYIERWWEWCSCHCIDYSLVPCNFTLFSPKYRANNPVQNSLCSQTFQHKWFSLLLSCCFSLI